MASPGTAMRLKSNRKLSVAAGRDLRITFTPHLIPMSRGELLTVYADVADGCEVSDIRAALRDAYADEPFVRLVPEGVVPGTQHVRGSNICPARGL